MVKVEDGWFQLNFNLPKFQLEIHHKAEDPSYKESYQERVLKMSNMHIFHAQRIQDSPILGLIEIEGLRIDLVSKNQPYFSELSIEMDSLSIHDPNVREEVESLNKDVKFTDKNKVSDFVLMTMHT